MVKISPTIFCPEFWVWRFEAAETFPPWFSLAGCLAVVGLALVFSWHLWWKHSSLFGIGVFSFLLVSLRFRIKTFFCSTELSGESQSLIALKSLQDSLHRPLVPRRCCSLMPCWHCKCISSFFCFFVFIWLFLVSLFSCFGPSLISVEKRL